MHSVGHLTRLRDDGLATAVVAKPAIAFPPATPPQLPTPQSGPCATMCVSMSSRRPPRCTAASPASKQSSLKALLPAAEAVSQVCGCAQQL
jgi:hypothetical protein